MVKIRPFESVGSKRVPLTKRRAENLPIRPLFLGGLENPPSFVLQPEAVNRLTAPNRLLQISISSSQVIFGILFVKKMIVALHPIRDFLALGIRFDDLESFGAEARVAFH